MQKVIKKPLLFLRIVAAENDEENSEKEFYCPDELQFLENSEFTELN